MAHTVGHAGIPDQRLDFSRHVVAATTAGHDLQLFLHNHRVTRARRRLSAGQATTLLCKMLE